MDRKDLIRAAWKRGKLSYKLRSHQKQMYADIWRAIDNKETSYSVVCARQQGKSFLALLIAFEYAIQNPGTRIPFAIPVSSNYKEMYSGSIDTIISDIPTITIFKDGKEEQIPDPSIAPIHNKADKTIVFPNKSWIKVSGVEKENYIHLRGAPAGLVFVDEAAFMSDLNKVIDGVLFPMTTTTDGLICNITTPPELPDHDFVEIFEKDKAKGLCSVYTIDDNKSLSEQTKKRIIEKYKSVQYPDGISNPTYQREYLAKFIRDANLTVVPEWSDSHIQPADRNDYFKFFHRYVGMDMGETQDFTVVLFGYYDFLTRTLYIEDEFQLNGPDVTTQVLADRIKQCEKELWGNSPVYRRIADNNNLQMSMDMTSTYKLPFLPVKKTASDTRNSILRGMINKVRVMVGEGRIKVNPKCEQLIGCLSFAQWSKDKTKLARSPKFGHYDALMALVYLVKMLDEHSNPIPALHGYNPENQLAPPGYVGTHTSQTEAWSKLYK